MKLLSVFFMFFCIVSYNSQTTIIDTIHKLPFSISNEKKLPPDELAAKREGSYLTGIPDINYDPLNGFGYGGEATLFFSGKRTDPFFEYTAYRAELNLRLFNTTNNQREIVLGCDIPYIFSTKWRLRAEVAYEINPNHLYFGIDENSLRGLQYYPNNDSTQSSVNDATYSNYENGLTANLKNYNGYKKEEALINVSMERSYLSGKLRALVGFEYAYVNFNPFAGQSLIRNDFETKKISGLGSNRMSFFQCGLIYDTRNLETDPTNGIFAEFLNEVSLTALGSQFNFNKTFAHINYYKSLFPSVFKRLVFAGRAGLGYTAGNAPFYEYQDQWSSEGSIEGLGGGETLRGYKQSRFLGSVMQFNNLEIRYKFAQTTLWKQNLVFSAVPFLDAGAVWNDFNTIKNFNNYRISEGLGLRIAWNVNTVLRFDYAISKEDNQFFFQLGHSF